MWPRNGWVPKGPGADHRRLHGQGLWPCRGLIDIVKAAGAELVGIGVAVEKGFQHGGDALREKGYPIHSLAVIEEATPDHITFREDDPV